MENNQGPNIGKVRDLKEVIDQKKKDNFMTSDMKELFSDLKGNSEAESVINDLFYKSVKNIFDFGYELADKLNLEFLSSFKFDKGKDKE